MTRLIAGLLMTVCILAPLSLRAQATPATPATPAPASPPVPPAAVAAAPAVPPADAVALCRDGTFIVAPGTTAGCEARGGLQVAMPRRVPPLPPVAAAAETRAETSDRERAAAAAPAGASMRCKDGTWLVGTQDAARCANAGGVALMIVQPLAAPPRRP